MIYTYNPNKYKEGEYYFRLQNDKIFLYRYRNLSFHIVSYENGIGLIERHVIPILTGEIDTSLGIYPIKFPEYNINNRGLPIIKVPHLKTYNYLQLKSGNFYFAICNNFRPIQLIYAEIEDEDKNCYQNFRINEFPYITEKSTCLEYVYSFHYFKVEDFLKIL